MLNFEIGEFLNVLPWYLNFVTLLDLVNGVFISAAVSSSLRIWNLVAGHLMSGLVSHTAATTCFEQNRLKMVSGREQLLKQ